VKIRALTLDAGHTLLFPNYARYADCACRHGADPSDTTDEALQQAERKARIVYRKMLRGSVGERPASFWDYFYAHLFREVGVQEDSLVDASRALYAEHLKGNGLFDQLAPEATQTLSDLRAAGIQLGVVSNAEGQIPHVLRSLQIDGYFRVILDSHLVGAAKPDPAIFKMALDAFGVAPAEAAHVGDYVEVDVVGARAAGMQAILYDPDDLDPGADCPRIRKLSDLLPLLASSL
jgi:REG-2-like HAD superfamily hydrolase